MKSAPVLGVVVLAAFLLSGPAFGQAATTTPSSQPAMPDAASQKRATELVNEVYGDELAKAKTPEQKVTLAKKMLTAAVETKDDVAGKYVLLISARELAVAGGDVATAYACIPELSAFGLDVISAKADALTVLAKTGAGRAPADLSARASALVDEAFLADRYDVAKRAADLVVSSAKASKNLDAIRRANAHAQDVKTAEAAYIDAQKAFAVLVSKPNDAAACLSAGRYMCFTKGNWSKGLGLLAKSSDPTLKVLAVRESEKVSDPQKQAAIADGWWGLAAKETGIAQQCIRQHAAQWYQLAVPGLKGLAKATAEKRLFEVATFGTSTPIAKSVKSIDLLQLINPKQDSIRGSWILENGELKSDGSIDSCLQIHYKPTSEYDFTIEFTRHGGANSVVQILTSNGRAFCFGIAGWNNAFSGFQIRTERATSFPMSIKNGTRHTSVIQVRKDRVIALFDGKVIEEYMTDFSEMRDLSPSWRLKDDSLIGVGSYQSPTTFHSIKIKEISGAAEESPSATTEVKEALLGKWRVSVGSYVATWEFHEDGTVTATEGTREGRWTEGDSQILIKWNDTQWESFRLPLADPARGDSWQGEGKLSATKIKDSR